MMEEAPAYFDWITETIASHVTGDVLEAGCGTGNGTGSLLRSPHVLSVTAIDISQHAIDEAQRRNRGSAASFRVQDLLDLPEASFNSIACGNVLEHIADEEQALRALKKALRPGGTLALLVPAHPLLYTLYDREAGHFRRYRRVELRRLLTSAGFRIDRLFHFNALGALGWFVTYGLLQRQAVREHQSRNFIRIFGRYVVPVARSIERFAAPPFGLSLIALCTKPNKVRD